MRRSIVTCPFVFVLTFSANTNANGEVRLVKKLWEVPRICALLITPSLDAPGMSGWKTLAIHIDCAVSAVGVDTLIT